jgi:RNA polymerase-binding transcription factor DksA
MAVHDLRLTREQLEFLRSRLEQERSRILAVLQPPPASDDERTEFEENAQRAAELSDRLDLDERERALLAEVERSLEKLRAGSYGVDEMTGAPIPYERLAAIPWARGAADE